MMPRRVRVSIALAAAVQLAVVGVASAEPRRYLVAVGNNFGHAQEAPLRYAERDAGQLAALLQRLGGIEAQNSVVSLGEGAAAVRSALLEVNARIRANAAEDTGGSVLVVYYSGHADALGLHLGESTLAYKDLKAMVRGSPATVRVLVIDGCRSGGLTRVKGVRPAPEFKIKLDQQLEAEGSAIITSSAAGEDSHESERLRGSFFTHHLMSALRGAGDSNRDGRVTLDEAYSYTYHQTLRSSGGTMSLQHPTYRFDVKGRGQLALTTLSADAARSARLNIAAGGLYLVMEGRDGGPVVAEVVVGDEGAQLVLPPGRYFVQQRARSFYNEYRVQLAPGATLLLAGQDYRRVAYARLVRKGGGARVAIHGLSVLGGARGEVLNGHGVAPQATVGYTLDLAWMTFGLRGRFARTVAPAVDGASHATHEEIAVGLTAERFIDLPWLSLSLGLLAEATYHRQTFDTTGAAPSRSTWGGGFGGMLAIEREIVPALVLRLEGGPIAAVYRHRPTDNGAPGARTETATPLTWYGAGGLVWRF